VPFQVIISEGVISAEAEPHVFRELTDNLLSLHSLAGNKFMTPNVIGEITVVPAGRSFSAGRAEKIAVVELKVPSFVLGTQELKDAWVAGVTDIIDKHAHGNIKRDRIYANVVYTVDGAWGIAGKAYTNEALGKAVSQG
jgi:hypothetical protein